MFNISTTVRYFSFKLCILVYHNHMHMQAREFNSAKPYFGILPFIGLCKQSNALSLWLLLFYEMSDPLSIHLCCFSTYISCICVCVFILLGTLYIWRQCARLSVQSRLVTEGTNWLDSRGHSKSKIIFTSFPILKTAPAKSMQRAISCQTVNGKMVQSGLNTEAGVSIAYVQGHSNISRSKISL